MQSGVRLSMAEEEIFLWGGHGLAAVLMIVYFVWENGPLHCSQRAESVTLTIALLLVYVSSALHNYLSYDDVREQSDGQFRQLIRLVFLAHILTRFVRPIHHPRFFDVSPCAKGGRRAALSQVPQPTLRAQRIALELDEALSEGLVQSGGSDSAMDNVWCPLLFVLLLLEEATHGHLAKADYLHALVCIEIVTIVSWCGFWLRRKWRLSILCQEIHRLLVQLVQNRDKDCLRYVLANISVGTLLEVARPDSIEKLTDHALEAGMLCPVSKAILVWALQQKGVRYSIRGQKAVWRMIYSCKGSELTTFKNLIDSSGGYLNLYRLVYECVSRTMRAELLEHLRLQALVLREEHGGPIGIKVVSDVDDTLYSSGGVFPAGCDARFPQHVVYPGCLELFRILDRGWSEESPSCNLIFISARPHIYKDVTEDRLYQRFEFLVEADKMHTPPTLLPGSLSTSLMGMLTAALVGYRGWRGVGENKARVFSRFRDLYLEYDYIFCGDNGQGDAEVAKHVADEQPDAVPARLLAALIHDVLPKGGDGSGRTPAVSVTPLRADLEANCSKEAPVILFRSYVGAATSLFREGRGILSGQQLQEVANAAVDDFDRLRLMYDECELMWAAVEAQLCADLDEADAALKEAAADTPALARPGSNHLLEETCSTPVATFSSSLSARASPRASLAFPSSPKGQRRSTSQWSGFSSSMKRVHPTALTLPTSSEGTLWGSQHSLESSKPPSASHSLEPGAEPDKVGGMRTLIE